jgi:hypothetical protein
VRVLNGAPKSARSVSTATSGASARAPGRAGEGPRRAARRRARADERNRTAGGQRLPNCGRGEAPGVACEEQEQEGGRKGRAGRKERRERDQILWLETSGLRRASACEHGERAKEDTHDGPRSSARAYPARCLEEPRLLRVATTAVNHALTSNGAAPGKGIDGHVQGRWKRSADEAGNGKAEDWRFPVLTQMERVSGGVRHAGRGEIVRGAGRTRGTSGADPGTMQYRVNPKRGGCVSEHENAD